MFIELLQHEEIRVLRFHGRFASGAQMEYLDKELRAIRSLESSKVLADFRDVSSIGSTGLAFVVAVFAAVTSRPGGHFVAIGLNPQVQKAFEITRLNELIPVGADWQAGMTLLRHASQSGSAHTLAASAAPPRT